MSLKTNDYDYYLPPELIATYPASPRESAKLLVYNRETDQITHTFFYEIERYIPQNVALIFNDTKVIKARIFGHKESGGKVELLINRALNGYDVNVYIRGRVKEQSKIDFEKGIYVRVIRLHEDGSRDVNFFQDEKMLRFEELVSILDEIGHIPLPPYLNREDESGDEINYQSVWAKNSGAVAAPTASLHFSDELFAKVTAHRAHSYLTLHVGSGTFKPVECEIITDHPMHSEYFDISKSAKEIIDLDQKILAIGTTSTRTIEYYAREKITKGEANIFLHPDNKPIRVNHLLTNFHLPKSTLLMLVASFVGVEKTHELYREAIKNRYRFFSYGDAMLII